jgi:hypothetical protein
LSRPQHEFDALAIMEPDMVLCDRWILMVAAA